MQNLLTFLVASILLSAAPGPDIIFVTTTALAKGARAGIVVALGLCTGVLAHITLAVAGVSLILKQSPLAFNAVKIAGTLYLLWLAFQAFKHRNDVPADGVSGNEGEKHARFSKLYRTGALMSMLNPKVALFFLAFLPQFVPENTESVWQYMLLLGAIFDVQAFCVFVVVSICAGTLFRALRERAGAAKWLNIMTAVVLVAIAVSLFFV